MQINNPILPRISIFSEATKGLNKGVFLTCADDIIDKGNITHEIEETLLRNED